MSVGSEKGWTCTLSATTDARWPTHFFAAMRDANEEVDIEALHNWYHQAGTPVVRCERKFDTTNGTYVLTFEQHLPTTAGDEFAKHETRANRPRRGRFARPGHRRGSAFA